MRYFLVTIVVLIINAVAMAAVYIYVYRQIDSQNSLVLQVQQEINGFSALGDQWKFAFSGNDVFEAKRQLIEQLAKKQGVEKELLSAVSLAIPKEVWLTKWLQTKRNIVLNGYAISNDILVNFINALTKNPMFASVGLTSTLLKKINNSNVFEFSLVCVLGGGSND